MCLGIPGRIVRIEDAEEMVATVDVCGVRRRINIACIVDAAHPVASCVDSWVLVHVGFAMSRIDEQEATETLSMLRELAEMQDELRALAMRPDDVPVAE